VNKGGVSYGIREKDRIIAVEIRQADFAQEQRALQSIHSQYFADVGRHAIVPQLGTGRMESRRHERACNGRDHRNIALDSPGSGSRDQAAIGSCE
jgi:hypothetical protein